MQSFDVLLVDSIYGQKGVMALIDSAWRYNGLMDAGIVNLNAESIRNWDALLAGAEIFQGENAPREIAKLIDSLQNVISTDRLKQLGVLVVDDLDAVRDVICAYIQALGYSVVHGASSGAEAMRMLLAAAESYFAVVADINMPGQSGIGLISEIRSRDILHRIPVIMLTAHPTASNLIESIRAGASGFLSKPPKRAQLRQELEKSLRIYRRRLNPRICDPEEAQHLEEILVRRGYALE
jgi:CheY-like chemotaxis protein